MPSKKPGLYANIHAKQERIAHGSKETPRKPGEEGAPDKDDFAKAAKTTKPAPARKAASRSTATKATKKSS